MYCNFSFNLSKCYIGFDCKFFTVELIGKFPFFGFYTRPKDEREEYGKGTN